MPRFRRVPETAQSSIAGVVESTTCWQREPGCCRDGAGIACRAMGSRPRPQFYLSQMQEEANQDPSAGDLEFVLPCGRARRRG